METGAVSVNPERVFRIDDHFANKQNLLGLFFPLGSYSDMSEISESFVTLDGMLLATFFLV